MTIRNTWLRGLAAAAVATPVAAFAQGAAPCPLSQQVVAFQPPSEIGPEQFEQRIEERPDVEPGAEVDQIIDRAEERADALDDQDERRHRETPPTRDGEANAPPSDEPVLPAEFRDLGLTEEEETAVLRVIRQYDRQIANVLDRFQDLHARAIGIEAIPVAQAMREKGDLELVDSPDGATQRTAGFRPGDAAEPGEETTPDQQAAEGAEPAEKIKELSERSPMAGPAAETWRKLHELHLQAVEIEAQKLVAIERLLPAEKLERLHKARASRPPGGAGVTEGDRPERPDLQNENQNPEEERRDRERDRAAGAGGIEAGEEATTDPNRSAEPRESGED